MQECQERISNLNGRLRPALEIKDFDLGFRGRDFECKYYYLIDRNQEILVSFSDTAWGSYDIQF